MKRKLMIVGLVLAALALLLYASRDFWVRQARIYVLGWMQVRAQETGFFLPQVDGVEILALGQGDVRARERFADDYPVLARTTMQGDACQVIADAWRFLPRNEMGPSWCHEPVYALRFQRGGKTIFETTICWTCGTYTIPLSLPFLKTAWLPHAFDPKAARSQQLLHLLQAQLPPPQSGLDGKPPAQDKIPAP